MKELINGPTDVSVPDVTFLASRMNKYKMQFDFPLIYAASNFLTKRRKLFRSAGGISPFAKMTWLAIIGILIGHFIAGILAVLFLNQSVPAHQQHGCHMTTNWSLIWSLISIISKQTSFTAHSTPTAVTILYFCANVYGAWLVTLYGMTSLTNLHQISKEKLAFHNTRTSIDALLAHKAVLVTTPGINANYYLSVMTNRYPKVQKPLEKVLREFPCSVRSPLQMFVAIAGVHRRRSCSARHSSALHFVFGDDYTLNWLLYSTIKLKRRCKYEFLRNTLGVQQIGYALSPYVDHRTRSIFKNGLLHADANGFIVYYNRENYPISYTGCDDKEPPVAPLRISDFQRVFLVAVLLYFLGFIVAFVQRVL